MLGKEISGLLITALKLLDVVLVLQVRPGAHPAVVHGLIGGGLDLIAHDLLVQGNLVGGLVLGGEQNVRRRLSLGVGLIQETGR